MSTRAKAARVWNALTRSLSHQTVAWSLVGFLWALGILWWWQASKPVHSAFDRRFDEVQVWAVPPLYGVLAVLGTAALVTRRWSSGRLLTMCTAIGVLLTGAALTFVVALDALLYLPLGGAFADLEIHADQAVVRDWHTKLAPALADLNAIGNIPGLKPAKRARINSCSYDSGELFDLSAGRYWDATKPGRTVEHPPASVTPGTAQAFLSIVSRLKKAGWHVGKKGNYLEMELPSGLTYDGVDLTKHNLGVTDELSIQLYDDGVNAYLTYSGARKACGGHWG